MIIGFGSLAASTPYLGLILLGIVGMWIYAAKVSGSAQRRMQRASSPSAQPATPHCGLPTRLLCVAQDLDWRFAAAQEEMARAAESADADDSAAPAAAETKPASA